MTKKSENSKRRWSKIYVPDELNDLAMMVSKRAGWSHENLHWFIFDAIRKQHPALVEKALDWLGRDWIDETASTPQDPPA